MTVENSKVEEKLETAEEITIEKATDEESTAGQPEQDTSSEEQVVENTTDWQGKVDALANELAQAKDHMLRAQAEVQNVKRRAQQDVEKAHKFALDKFVESLLPVVDSLEKGIESTEQAEGSHEGIKEGMELTLKLFLDTLARFSVKPVDPEGEPFDPHFHQAMSTVPNPDVEPNTVLEVFQKGYTLNERVVRPAMVVVSKGS
ncbi:nucleotide exchange factor GrpE [Candidatus Sororendozoicomonas aggregata]|uniref:nucleotide exchange factor GrpE n=1 Tax=Candidatus Sororendozoicomonas aggregata TaxID=3073239 RepID=UPI002ED62688